MTVPAWIWAASAAGLLAVVAVEVTLTRRLAGGSFTVRAALTWVGIYVSLAVIFGLALGVLAGWVPAGQFYAGYLTEYSLSLDNLLIFATIMNWFAVPPARQPRVLVLGIGLALVLRSALIVAGAAALSRAGWLYYPLGGILVWTAVGLISGPRGHQPEPHGRLVSWLRRGQAAGRQQGGRPSARWAAIPVTLILAIGLADVVFAADSIPAVFGITTSAYLIVACNAFALMGLRQLYVLLARVLQRIAYLNTGLGVICAFIGAKLLLRALRASGAPWAVQVPDWLSIVVVAAVLLVTVLAGMIGTARSADGARRPLTAGERTVLERRFTVLDTGGTGVWRREDYERLTRRLCATFGHAPDSGLGRAAVAGQRVLFDALLAHMDADHNQEITRDEFVAAAGRTVQDRPGFDAAVRTAARTLVQAADQDGNGVLDAGEYAKLAAVYGAGPEEAARAFGLLDQDGNGALDIAELTLAIGQFFTSRDARAPGNVAFGRL